MTTITEFLVTAAEADSFVKLDVIVIFSDDKMITTIEWVRSPHDPYSMGIPSGRTDYQMYDVNPSLLHTGWMPMPLVVFTTAINAFTGLEFTDGPLVIKQAVYNVEKERWTQNDFDPGYDPDNDN